MKMSIKKFAELTGVSVRTLHYYDEIELLKPDFVDGQNGYRFYGTEALSRMQEIMFYRELDFPLKTIAEIISSPDYDKTQALKGQKQLLILKKQRLERIINAIECVEKGEQAMNFEAFNSSELTSAKEAYKAEVKQRWGKTEAFKESEKRTAGYSDENFIKIEQGINSIMAEFAALKSTGVSPSDEAAFEAVEKLKDFITQTQYNCTNAILSCLGDMYVSDERFKKNIDRNGTGTAEFINTAIKEFVFA